MSINTGTGQQAGLNAAAAATFVVFGINGLVFASWAARIPAVTETLEITSGQMGTLLLCTAVGSLLAILAPILLALVLAGAAKPLRAG
jgi:hypothetical protein